jgi:hypothetical protein
MMPCMAFKPHARLNVRWPGLPDSSVVGAAAATPFLDARWDFMGETANGSEDIWKIAEDLGYPRLWWESKYIYD